MHKKLINNGPQCTHLYGELVLVCLKYLGNYVL